MAVPEPPHQRQNFLGGFKLTLEHLGPAAGHPAVPRGEAAEAAPPARPSRPQPVRGRHGEVHRLRAVRRGVPGRLHLRARPGQPARPSGVARRALRLRLRDQLPAVHPLRPVRGGLPDRGHHRVEADGVLLHQPQRRHLHQGGAAGRRRRQAPAPALGGLAGGRRPLHLGMDAGHLAVGERRVRGPGPVVGRARLRGALPGERARPRAATTPPPAAEQLRDTLERHLRPGDLPAAKRGPRGAIGRMLEKAERFAPGAGKKHRPEGGRRVRRRGEPDGNDRAGPAGDRAAPAHRAGRQPGSGPGTGSSAP